MTDEISKLDETGVRDDIQIEIAELAQTISQIEFNFNDIKRVVQNIDAHKVIQVAGKFKAYAPEWTKLHNEYTALVHDSQLNANKVQSKIKCLLDIIKGHGDDHKGLRTHLSTYIKDLNNFLDKATPIETRFLRLSQDVESFRQNLQDDVAAQVDLTKKTELKEIDLRIKNLQAQLIKTSQTFVKSWVAMKEKTLEDWRSDPQRTFLATAGIAALAPYTAYKILHAHLNSLGFFVQDALNGRQHLKEQLKGYQKQRKVIFQKLDTLKDIEEKIEKLDVIFSDTMSRLYTVQDIWHALRMDAHTLQFELESSTDLQSESETARRIAIGRFSKLYLTLCFALDIYIKAVAKTEQTPVHHKNHPSLSGTNASDRSRTPSEQRPGFFASILKSRR